MTPQLVSPSSQTVISQKPECSGDILFNEFNSIHFGVPTHLYTFWGNLRRFVLFNPKSIFNWLTRVAIEMLWEKSGPKTRWSYREPNQGTLEYKAVTLANTPWRSQFEWWVSFYCLRLTLPPKSIINQSPITITVVAESDVLLRQYLPDLVRIWTWEIWRTRGGQPITVLPIQAPNISQQDRAIK